MTNVNANWVPDQDGEDREFTALLVTEDNRHVVSIRRAGRPDRAHAGGHCPRPESVGPPALIAAKPVCTTPWTEGD